MIIGQSNTVNAACCDGTAEHRAESVDRAERVDKAEWIPSTTSDGPRLIAEWIKPSLISTGSDA